MVEVLVVEVVTVEAEDVELMENVVVEDAVVVGGFTSGASNETTRIGTLDASRIFSAIDD